MDFSANDETQPISDDQELAKALAGVVADEPEQPAPALNEAMPELPGAINVPVTSSSAPAMPVAAPATVEPAALAAPTTPTPAAEAPSALDGIKKDALDELRPLVDRVDLSAEDKFDIYLMLIRSTDDSSLIGPAHTASQGITDEKRKAEALLEIIKEIDYLTRK